MLASEVDKESGRRTRYRMELPLIEGNYTGTGDLTTALLMAFYTQFGVKEAMTKTGSVLQSVINRTRDYHEAHPGVPRNPPELRLIQSKRDIENPCTQYDITTWIDE
ncbi:pyridoxine kinase, putative [Perkinsus marinus ATCC 50983]|uniref:pyridoxal kinase n=1 Tax=Perkinsus marinus (strain ATCC 50983 / TXsc) TaxID=423536 RepID=C5KMG6_PERM5|nr:pyridoxine kinase, putative [Perkinsus marinus ATCC 50983]EER14327.1 pyridoxine kinase, putative [Perkinsus marinus ATCC 50983]|eukprot:XP_002782532.1 pyridoxine kinase, putative [Perkinsus marinus ATCC 50983]